MDHTARGRSKGASARKGAAQRIPAGWSVDVIIVDDGSPCLAEDELRGLDFRAPWNLRILHQENGGAGAARNRGLDTAGPSTTLIAFLDSDDIWPANHLARAIQAIEEGYDFYFTDNNRKGHHDSHCHSPYVAETAAYIDAAPQKSGFLEIPKDLMVGLTLTEFPCQASTVVCTRTVSSGLRFDARLRSSGEDVLFFSALASASNRVCFDLDSMVECGAGVNIYFANLSWDSDRLLSIKVDILVTHHMIAESLKLSSRNKQLNNGRLAGCRRDLAFHMLRNLPKNPARVFREIKRLFRIAPGAAVILPLDMIRVPFDKSSDRNKHKREE